MTTETPVQMSLRVRRELLETPGAQLCEQGNCAVITQGGPLGMAKHLNAVHGGRYDVPGGPPGRSRK